MLLSIILGTLVGITIFFIGIAIMSNSVTTLGNQHLKRWISLFTTNPLLGIIVGMIVTGLTQSSSGTTVLVVSLVNAGAMNLYQATAVIMGANIGTTFTAQLISFNFLTYVPQIMFVGVLLFYLDFGRSLKNLGKFLIGFSLLFLGIKYMSFSLDPLKNLMGFQDLMLSIEQQQMKGVLIGAVTTAIIQSSSTGVAILQSLGFQGMITIFQAMPIILGQNIGTCVTTLLASIPADKNGKRAAIIHLLFNVSGVLFLYPFMNVFSHFIYQITPDHVVKQIANAHTLFNIINVVILLPFIKPMVHFSKKK